MSAIDNFKYLNKAQLEAVNYINGPLLVLAGAGSGKTKLLTSRIVNLIHNHNVNPDNILAVTFTNKAANVMKRRINNMLQEGNITDNNANILQTRWIGTFHSLSAKILRKHIHLIGYDNNFTIIDQDDQLRLVKRIVKSLDSEDINLEKVNFKAIINQISLWKDKNIQADNMDQIENKYNNFITLCKLVYPLYQLELRKANGCDFGDLIIHVINLLANNATLQQYYNEKFKYILVDEYQDTNMVQYLWLRLLTQGHNNICCVGDDDQSIYGFRGAEVENILHFEEDFDNAKIIKLQQNYRSTKHILNVASYLINHNNNRHKKTLFTDRASGNKVNIIDSWDDQAEAHNISKEVQKLIKEGCEINEIAILIRASFQSRSFEESLISNNISYKVIGGLKFYDRKEIRDVIAYLRIINSVNDNLALERIINVPKRGIGAASLKKIYNFNNSKIDNEQDFSLFSNICNFLTENKISSKINLALKELTNLIKEAKELEKTISLSDLAKYIITNSGYEQMLKESKEYNSETRLENLTEFFSALDEFSNLGEFLEHVSLVNETQDNDINNSINIITLHSAKGLEFDAVFLAGWEEGLFPHQRSIDESGNKGLEEERRLAYVGITRAKKNLYISHCANRRMYNKWQVNTPSRFLQELPVQDINNYASKTNNQSQNNYKYKAKSNYNIIKLAVNDDVIHKTLGNGTIKSLIGDVVEVNFDSGKSRFVTAKTLVKIS
jgi:DNA helicase-2/ATP-dependent DNA helicase PcrA